MQNISTVNVKKTYYILWSCSYFAKCSRVLAISIPYCATYGLMNLANVQAKIIICEKISVSVSLSALSVCSFSDYTDNSLRALSKLFMCKSCTGNNLSVRNRCTGTRAMAHKRQRRTHHHSTGVKPVRGSSAEASVCRSVIPRLCESRSLSHRLKRCNSISLPFTDVTVDAVSLCMFCRHSSSICSHFKALLWILRYCFIPNDQWMSNLLYRQQKCCQASIFYKILNLNSVFRNYFLTHVDHLIWEMRVNQWIYHNILNIEPTEFLSFYSIVYFDEK